MTADWEDLKGWKGEGVRELHIHRESRQGVVAVLVVSLVLNVGALVLVSVGVARVAALERRIDRVEQQREEDRAWIVTTREKMIRLEKETD